MSGVSAILAGLGDGFSTSVVTLGSNQPAGYLFSPSKLTNYVPGRTRAILVINSGVTISKPTDTGSSTTFTLGTNNPNQPDAWSQTDKIVVINYGTIINTNTTGIRFAYYGTPKNTLYNYGTIDAGAYTSNYALAQVSSTTLAVEGSIIGRRI